MAAAILAASPTAIAIVAVPADFIATRATVTSTAAVAALWIDAWPTAAAPAPRPITPQFHGSAYYGRNYGAPYFGGGYYDRGIYYRERRD